jgi:uncharacterized membrane protein
MEMSGLDQVFWFGVFSGELALILVLFARREFRRFPIFLTSIVVQAGIDPVLYYVANHGSSLAYARAYTDTSLLDYVLQFGVLLEIAYAVLKPLQQNMPRRMLAGLAVVLLLLFGLALVWTPSDRNSANFQSVFAKLEQMDFVFSFLRLGLFALIAACSQLLGITWKNHVVRLAGGLAFYSAVSLVVQLTIAHLPQTNHELYRAHLRLLERTRVISYLAALAFWVWSFVQKDAPRREFTPQMEGFLVTIAESAKRSRVGFTRSLGHK